MYAVLANVTVAAHSSFVLFLIFGALLVKRWPRMVHLHVSAVVYAILVQTIGFSCFLTDVEKSLRQRAGQEPYAGEFLYHYVWSHMGLTGSEPIITLGLLALIAAVSLRPYRAWAAAR